MAAKRKSSVSSDEEFEDDQVESESEAQVVEASKSKRQSKPTTKRRALEKENIDAKMRQLERLQKEIKTMARMQKGVSEENDDNDSQNDVESEDEEAPTSGFSSSIKALATVAIPNAQTKTPIRRVGAAAAKAPPKVVRIASTAFKGLAPSAQRQYSTSPSQAAARNGGAVPEPPSDDSGLPPLPSSPLGGLNRPNVTSELGETDPPPLKAPAFRKGITIDPKHLKAGDFEGVVNALIIRSAAEYEALLSTKSAFPDTALRIKWAKQCWKNAGIDAGEAYEMTDGIGRLIRGRGSRIRGFALGRIRALLVNILGFKTSTSTRSITHNQDLYRKFKANACFHYKDPEARSGFAQGKIISESIRIVWFEDKRSHGVVYEKLFNPVPLETFALVFTIIDWCLEEFSSGRCVKATMWEKDVLARHKNYQTDLQNWQELNPTAVKGIRKKYYLRGSRSAGVLDETAIQLTLTGAVKDQAREELEGRTGETDSEAEGA